MKFDRKRHYSLRKYKSVGLASAIVGLSMLGTTGVLNDVPVVGSLFGVSEVSAASISSSVTFVTDTGASVSSLPIEWQRINRGNVDSFTVTITAPTGYVFTDNNQSHISFEKASPETLNLTVRKVGGRDFNGNTEDGYNYNTSDGRVDGDGSISTVYQPNPNGKAGEQNVVSQGTPGKSRYHSDDGRNYTTIYEPGTPRVVSVGTQPTVTNEEIQPTEKRFVKDPERERGAEDIVEKGQVGRKEVTTTYTLNISNGTVSPNTPTSRIISNPTPTIVKVAAKDKVETIQRGRQTVEKTTVYTVNETTGAVTESVSERVVKEITYSAADNIEAGKKVPSPNDDSSVAVGTKPKVEETRIPFDTRYEPNPQADRDVRSDKVVGKDGKTIKTTTYTLNKETGAVTPDAPTTRTEPAVTRVVSVGTKPKTVTEVIASPKEFVKDPTREKGAENIEVAGTPGRKETTTTYDLNTTTGVITDRVGQPVTTPPTKTVVKVAAKDKVVSTPIASPKKYRGSETKDYGSDNTEVAGTPGVRKVTTVYTVDPTNGTISEKSTTTETAPTDTIVTVGTKPTVTSRKDDQGRTEITTTTYVVAEDTGKVTPTSKITYGETKEPTVATEEIPSPKKYEKDPTREKGAENITVPGKAGKKVTTTTYTVDPASGKVTPTVGQPVITEPTATIIKVAAKDKVVVTELPSPKKYENDDSRTKGTPNVEVPGKAGKEVATTVYTVNPDTGDITEVTNTVRESEPTATIVKVASKPEVDYGKTGGSVVENKTEFTVDPNTGELKPTTTSRTLITDKEEESPIPSPEKYVADKSREKGTENVREEGVPGIEVTRTSYSMNPSTGKIDEAVTKFVKKQPTETIIKVGAKDKVVVTTIPKETRYEKDPSREKGDKDITVEGTDGTSTVTTTYTVDPTTGGITENTGKPVVVNPTTTIVKVAAKDKVVETIINSPRKYVGDVLKTKGTENEIFLGHNGKDITTTVYTVNPLTGAITESSSTKHAGVATETVIRVGAKPIVELEKKDGIVYRNTTTFAVDLNTGEITETKLREALYSFGNEAAPTVEVPDFNGGVNGDMDGNAAINEVPEFTGGVGTAGEELPPVLDVPEFTGGVNGDMDGQPAINEVPEFDLSTLKPEPEYGIGDTFNDGRYPKPAVEDEKPSIDEAPAVSDVEVVPADKKVVEPTVSNESPSASPLANNVVEAPNAVGTSTSAAPTSALSGNTDASVAELPNTGGGDNAMLGMAGLALGALGLASLKKKED